MSISKFNNLVINLEDGSRRDWVSLYCSAFDEEQRQPVAEVRELIADGRILLFTVRDETTSGKLQAFATVSIHNERELHFANLDFTAVIVKNRSHGIGTQLVQHICSYLRANFPSCIALTIEMDRRNEPGISVEEVETRNKRARFYNRLNARQLPVDYYILSFDDPDYRGAAEFWALEFDGEIDVREAVFAFYTSQAGYALDADNVAVKEVMSQFEN